MYNKSSLSLKTLLVECENCNNKFVLTNSILKYRVKVQIEGEIIFLSYYDCPKCGRRHFVQVDDQKSINLNKKSKELFVKLSKLREDDKEISKKSISKFNKIRKNLNNYRIILMEKYTNKKAILENDTFTLKFSV